MIPPPNDCGGLLCIACHDENFLAAKIRPSSLNSHLDVNSAHPPVKKVIIAITPFNLLYKNVIYTITSWKSAPFSFAPIQTILFNNIHDENSKYHQQAHTPSDQNEWNGKYLYLAPLIRMKTPILFLSFTTCAIAVAKVLLRAWSSTPLRRQR